MAQSKPSSDLDSILNASLRRTSPAGDGPFTAEFREGKNGVTYGSVVCRDERIHWRFRQVHPAVVALILKHPAEAAKAASAAAQGPKITQTA